MVNLVDGRGRGGGHALIYDPGRIGDVAQLGTDETSFLAANAAHPTAYVTGLVDLQRRRLLDVVEGNRSADVARWLGDRRRCFLLARIDAQMPSLLGLLAGDGPHDPR